MSEICKLYSFCLWPSIIDVLRQLSSFILFYRRDDNIFSFLSLAHRFLKLLERKLATALQSHAASSQRYKFVELIVVCRRPWTSLTLDPPSQEKEEKPQRSP